MPKYRFALSLACVPLVAFALATGPLRAPSAVGASASAAAQVPIAAEEHEARVTADAAAPEEPSVLVHGAGTGGGDVAEVEPNDAMAQANAARDLPFQCSGTIAVPGDVDFVSVAVTEGQRVEADAFAVIGALASPLDPRLTVYASNGLPIASNDDATPSTPNACVVFDAPYTGTIYLAVASAGDQAGEDCDYLLAMWPVTTDVFSAANLELEPNDELDGVRLMALPGVMRGTIATATDRDFVRFEITGWATIVVDLHSESYGLPLDARVDLFDTDGTRIWRSDDMDGADPRFNVVLPMPGVYGLCVMGHDTGGAGYDYILSASLQDATDAPFMTKMRYSIVDGEKYIKRVTGRDFDPSGARIEVAGRVVPSRPLASKPATVVKATPPALVKRGASLSVVNPDGRRSNAYVLTPRR